MHNFSHIILSNLKGNSEEGDRKIIFDTTWLLLGTAFKYICFCNILFLSQDWSDHTNHLILAPKNVTFDTWGVKN